MRSATIVLSCVLLAMFFVRSSDAVACSTTILTNCTDCTDGNNVDDDDCTTTTTTTTEETITLRNNVKTVRVTNLRYTNIRRLRLNRPSGSGSGTGVNTRNTRNTRNRNSRRNNVRVYRG